MYKIILKAGEKRLTTDLKEDQFLLELIGFVTVNNDIAKQLFGNGMVCTGCGEELASVKAMNDHKCEKPGPFTSSIQFYKEQLKQTTDSKKQQELIKKALDNYIKKSKPKKQKEETATA